MLDVRTIDPVWKFYAGGEGTQASLFMTPVDVYLPDGETVQLFAPYGEHVRLELVALLSALEA